jgi:hypothetical protein
MGIKWLKPFFKKVCMLAFRLKSWTGRERISTVVKDFFKVKNLFKTNQSNLEPLFEYEVKQLPFLLRLIIVIPAVFEDERGCFMEYYIKIN